MPPKGIPWPSSDNRLLRASPLPRALLGTSPVGMISAPSGAGLPKLSCFLPVRWGAPKSAAKVALHASKHRPAPRSNIPSRRRRRRADSPPFRSRAANRRRRPSARRAGSRRTRSSTRRTWWTTTTSTCSTGAPRAPARAGTRARRRRTVAAAAWAKGVRGLGTGGLRRR